MLCHPICNWLYVSCHNSATRHCLVRMRDVVIHVLFVCVMSWLGDSSWSCSYVWCCASVTDHCLIHMRDVVTQWLMSYSYVWCHASVTHHCLIHMRDMGWLWLVGSIKLKVSFAKEPYKRDNILPKRPTILSILLTVATPYRDSVTHHHHWPAPRVCTHVYIICVRSCHIHMYVFVICTRWCHIHMCEFVSHHCCWSAPRIRAHCVYVYICDRFICMRWCHIHICEFVSHHCCWPAPRVCTHVYRMSEFVSRSYVCVGVTFICVSSWGIIVADLLCQCAHIVYA